MAEKNCFGMTKLIFEVMCFTVVLERADKPGSTPGDAIFCFFFLFGLFFFNTNFPFGPFFFILTADPASHALGSMYILSFKVRSFILKKKKERKKPVPLYIVVIINIITLKSPLGQLPPKNY